MEKHTKVLIISGPTATGKTDLAVTIAKKYNGELINADSRQVYKGLEIGVGKDHPKDTPIHLLDLITPDKIFSVAEFQKQSLAVISDILSRGKLPIVVGGSGFYIDSIINSSYDTFSVRPNKILRAILNQLPLTPLQWILRTVDSKTYKSLNNSDIHNPRRLVRKIELAFPSFGSSAQEGTPTPTNQKYDILHISLTAPSEYIYKRIDKRVDSRLKLGHLTELKKLLKKYSWSDPGLNVACYFVFKDYLNKKISLDEVKKLWSYAEHADARHQKTWFRRYQDACFIDVSKGGWQKSALKKVSTF